MKLSTIPAFAYARPMSARQFARFRHKVAQLNAFLALADADQALHRRLVDCSSHEEVVAIALEHGFVINKRWGDSFDDDEGHEEPEDPAFSRS